MRAAVVSIAAALAMSLLADTACAYDPAGHQRASVPGRAPSPISVPLDAPSRATLQRHPVPVPGDGRTLQCEGVALSALLQASGAMPDRMPRLDEVLTEMVTPRSASNSSSSGRA